MREAHAPPVAPGPAVSPGPAVFPGRGEVRARRDPAPVRRTGDVRSAPAPLPPGEGGNKGA